MNRTISLQFCSALLLLSTNLSAQTFTLYGDRAFGGTESEANAQIIPSGNKLILFGHSQSDISGEVTDLRCPGPIGNEEDCWIVKFDANFSTLSNENLGGNREEYAPGAIKNMLNPSELLFAITSNSDSSCDKSENNISFPNHNHDYWICKIDSNANKIWDKTYGGIATERYPKIIQVTSGDYIVCGLSGSPIGGDKTVANYGSEDFWVLKLDGDGNKLWDKVYGGTGLEIASESYLNWDFSLLAEADGGFCIAGTSESNASGDISEPAYGSCDYWIIKLDSDGNKIWDKRYGGSLGDWCSRIIATSDNGYLVLGSTRSPNDGSISEPLRGETDIWIVKLDSIGNKIWDRRYGGTNYEFVFNAEEMASGGYWISGSTQSEIGFEISEPSYGLQDYWMLKIDSVGNKIWDKRFGGPGNDSGANFVIMPDSSIFLCGSASPGKSVVKTDGGEGGYDYWVVHFKLSDTTTGIIEAQLNSITFSIYPNPAADNITITANKPVNGLRILNVLGEVVQQQAFTSATVARADVSQLPDGVYFVQVSGNNASGVMKFVKLACR